MWDPNKYHTQSDTPHEIFTLDFSRTPKHTLHITNIFICAHTQQFQIQMDELGQFHIAWVCRKRSPCLRFIIFYVHSFFWNGKKKHSNLCQRHDSIKKFRKHVYRFIYLYIYLILNGFLFLNFLPLVQKAITLVILNSWRSHKMLIVHQIIVGFIMRSHILHGSILWIHKVILLVWILIIGIFVIIILWIFVSILFIENWRICVWFLKRLLECKMLRIIHSIVLWGWHWTLP